MSAGPINTAETAARLGSSITTIIRLASTGELPYLRKLPGLRGGYLFDPAVVDLYGREHPARGRGWPRGRPRKKDVA